MSDRIFLDTNVLVYAYDTSDPLKQKRAQDILRSGMLSGSALVSAQVLGELFVVLTRKIPQPLMIADAIGVVRALEKLDVVETGVLAVNLALAYCHEDRNRVLGRPHSRSCAFGGVLDSVHRRSDEWTGLRWRDRGEPVRFLMSRWKLSAAATPAGAPPAPP